MPEKCYVRVLYCVADLPAKCLLLHCQQYNGSHGCTECEIEGQVISKGRGHSTVFWTPTPDTLRRRTHASVTSQAEKALETDKVSAIKRYTSVPWSLSLPIA